MILKPVFIIIILLEIISPLEITAQIKLPDVFSDHMVIQRELPIRVWGSANPQVRIEVNINQNKSFSESDNEGNWNVELPAMKAGGPYQLIIHSEHDSVSIKDIYIGEVWLCSGQSNMEWALKQSAEGENEIPNANLPLIRLFHLKKKHDTYSSAYSEEELESYSKGDFFEEAKWELCTSETAADFSAVGYFFGKNLMDSLNVPIGLIQFAVGGSPAQSWIDKQSLEEDEELKHLVDGRKHWTESELIHPWLAERARENWANYDFDRNKALPGHPFAPAYLYDSGIKPLAPFVFRGAIWYQGESNATHPQSYQRMMELLVKSWRDLFKNKDFPFYYVQLPKIGNRSLWPELREAQEECLSIKNSGMAVIIDQGHPIDVHPKEKEVVGYRLALQALYGTYGHDVPALSPMFDSYDWDIDLKQIKISFKNTYQGLSTRDGSTLKGFKLQGYVNQGRNEVIIDPEKIVLGNDHIILHYPSDFLLVKVKYTWAPFPENNIINHAGLPMAPFKIELKGSN